MEFLAVSFHGTGLADERTGTVRKATGILTAEARLQIDCDQQADEDRSKLNVEKWMTLKNQFTSFWEANNE